MKMSSLWLACIFAILGLALAWIIKATFRSQPSANSGKSLVSSPKAKTENPEKKKNGESDKAEKSAAEMMSEMRLKSLTSPPSNLNLKPTPEFPNVVGVLMDWPLSGQVVTAVSFCTGDASIYTTSTFGVLGGIGHESVRNAAIRFVTVAEHHYKEAISTKEFPYPPPGKIRFYLVCFDGVRVVETSVEEAQAGKYSDLGAAGQSVITELRLLTQNK